MIRHVLRSGSSPVLVAGLVLAAACSGDAKTPFGDGFVGPPGKTSDAAAAAGPSSDARPADGARLDTSSSPMGLSGMSGSGSGGSSAGGGAGGSGPTGTGGGGGGQNPNKDAGGPDGPSQRELCRQCEMAKCLNFQRTQPTTANDAGFQNVGIPKDRYTPCLEGKDSEGKVLPITAGPRKDMSASALCTELRDCIVSTNCAHSSEFTLSDCLCGSNSQNECAMNFDKQSGACHELIQAAAEVEDPKMSPSVVKVRLFNENFVAGRAFALYVCDLQMCPSECANLPAPDGGVKDAAGTTPPPTDASDAAESKDMAPGDEPMMSEVHEDVPPDVREAGSDGGLMVQSNACRQCMEDGQASSDIQVGPNCTAAKIKGCAGATTDAQKAACSTFERCVLDTGCWYNGPTGKPLDCICGTNQGTKCQQEPNGACLKEATAAAAPLVTSPTDYVGISRAQNNTNLPIGMVMALFNCQKAAGCTDICKVLVEEGKDHDAGARDVGADLEPDAEPDVGPDVGPDATDVAPDLPPDMSMMGDAPPGAGGCVDCCRESRRGKDLPYGCNSLMGCENITDAADKQLCVNLRSCMYAHPTCWQDGTTTSCFCGTATTSMACNMAPNGPCVAEVMAAAKVPATDYANANVRFFNTNFPSGHATQQIACERKCLVSTTTPDCPSFEAPLAGTCNTNGTGGSGGDTGGTGGGGTGGGGDTGGTGGGGTGGGTGGAGTGGAGTGGAGTGGAGTGGAGTGGVGTGGAGTGGAGTGGAGTGGAGTGGAGTGGAGTGGGGALCPDLDMNGESDCTQSKVTNPNFAIDLSGWNIPAVVTADWTETGAQGAATGAIYANNIQFNPGQTFSVGSGPEQCIAATPGTKYKIYAEAFIASADSPGPGTGVSVNVTFYQAADCPVGTPSVGSSTPTVMTQDVWSLLQGTATAPAGTVSMRVRLSLLKPINQASFKATFDNVLVAPVP